MDWENILKEKGYYSTELTGLITQATNLGRQKEAILKHIHKLMYNVKDIEPKKMILEQLDMEEEAQQHLRKIELFLQKRESMR